MLCQVSARLHRTPYKYPTHIPSERGERVPKRKKDERKSRFYTLHSSDTRFRWWNHWMLAFLEFDSFWRVFRMEGKNALQWLSVRILKKYVQFHLQTPPFLLYRLVAGPQLYTIKDKIISILWHLGRQSSRSFHVPVPGGWPLTSS